AGIINRIFVIEIDTPLGHNVDGAASLRALEVKHGVLPETLMAESPSGSLHYYFEHPGDGVEIKNSASELGKGIDGRGDGGMVIAPPSRRRDGQYRWFNKLNPAKAPAWLIALVRKQPAKISVRAAASIVRSGRAGGYGEAALKSEIDTLANWPAGS